MTQLGWLVTMLLVVWQPSRKTYLQAWVIFPKKVAAFDLHGCLVPMVCYALLCILLIVYVVSLFLGVDFTMSRFVTG